MEKEDDNQPVSPAPFNTSQQIKPTKFEPVKAEEHKPSFSIRTGTLVISILVIFCASVAWFLFTAKAVYFEIIPRTAHINVSSVLQLKLADRYLLRSGDYRIAIEAEGYYPLEQSLTVGNEQNQRYPFELKRLPGHLQIDTSPVTGAEVFIDDAFKGETPTVIRSIPHGEHQLRIIADRYFPFETDILIEGLDREQSLKADLVPAWADVTFATQPDGADVFVDDEVVGQTPLTAEILEGEHAIRIKLSGYKDWQNKIQVVANEPMQISDIKLELADAVVFLVSTPPRASVTLDGVYKGLTPLELAVAPGKKTTIRLFKQGYKPTTRQLTATSGDQQRLRISLEPELVDVAFDVTPADAKLFIDDKPYGTAKQTLQLSAKKHRIKIRKEGYVDYQTTITPHSGIAQQVKVKLKTLQQAKLEKIKPVIRTHAGQSLKLFYPSGFTMGASRREPGRRANETLRKIELVRPFYMGLHEVTNEQYRLLIKVHSSGLVQGSNLNGDKQPVVKITWEQAAIYCNWLSKEDSLTPFYQEKDGKIIGFNTSANGYRLPTEAEWAWSARVENDNSILKFPWGGEMPPAVKSGNYADEHAGGILGKIIRGYQDGFIATAPVGSFPANHKGLFDMGGNVAEWIHDYYDIAIGNPAKAEVDPVGSVNGEFHVVRGSSWAHGTVTELRLSYRDYSAKVRDDIGFRIARYLE